MYLEYDHQETIRQIRERYQHAEAGATFAKDMIEKNRHATAEKRNQIPTQQTSPPRFLHFMLLLIPQRNRKHLLGDLEEEFRTIVLPQHGRFLASCWYCEQVMLAIGFYLWPTIKKILGLSVLYKFIGR